MRIIKTTIYTERKCNAFNSDMLQIVWGKNDGGIRIGESDIKFERIAELKIVNEQVFIEIVIK